MNNQLTPQNSTETISMNVVDFDSIQLNLASPEDILSWSYGEVTKPETINYRTQKAEKDGLFSEKIFGPVKDYECSCGKYRRIRYKGIVCDKCGVEVTKASVRRERMGHIELAVPIAHIWFLRNVPSRISLVLDQTLTDVEKVVYYSSYIITEVDENLKKDYVKQVESEYKSKLKDLTSSGHDSEESLKEMLDSKQQNLDFLNSLEKWNIISEIDYRLMSMKFAPVFKAETGSTVLRDIFVNIDLEAELANLDKELEVADGVKAQKILKKIRFLGGLHKAGVRPEWMFLTHLPVIPPDLRPMVALDGGRFATSDLNDLYRRVINRNNRLKKLMSQRAPEVIVRNEKRMLQEAVDALIDNSMRKGQSTTVASTGQKRALKSLADSLKGKQGRFRQNLLGKRVDYSARSVIVVGPNLKINECGIPKTMALELFKPFIINRLIEDEYAHNIRSATRLIEQGIDIVWDILDEVIEHRYVLLNRAPTLHRLSIQAFKPVLIEGKAIQLNPMVCSPFNADFDGDQMAVHVPLSEEAVKEAGELMISDHNLIKPSDGSPSSAPSQDMVLGIYYTTLVDDTNKGDIKVFNTFDEAVGAYDHNQIGLRELVEIKKEVKVGGKPIQTTVGRISFNEILPSSFEYINEVVGKKQLKNILNKALYDFSQPEVGELLDRIKKFGFAEMTKSGLSWAISDFTVSDERDKLIKKAQDAVEEISTQFEDGLLTEKERYAQIVDIWSKASIEIGALVKSEVNIKGPVFSMIDSGARGSWGQLTQMAGMKGLVVSPSGKIIETPVTSSFLKGLTELEYFISTHGARKGLVDTALKTATSGYLTRRLVDVNQDVVVKEVDCVDTDGLLLTRLDAEYAGDNFENFVFGRKSIHDIADPKTKTVIVKAGELITHQQAKAIDESGVDNIRIRSLVSCKTIRGVCQSCYGIDLGRNEIVKVGEAVGIVTAQAIGEPATQLTMRTFHQGGSAGAADVTKGLPRVEEVFEARNPKTPAIMSTVNGVVVDVIETAGEIRIKIKTDDTKATKSKAEIKEIVADPIVDIVIVKTGDTVVVGQPLTEGHLDLEKLYKQAGIEPLTRYVIQQILEIYNSQGAGIAIKHVEMIVRQMTSRYMVVEPGKSDYLKGQTITRDQLLEFNNSVDSKDDLIQVEPLLQGITKVALNTESFLSAASFQNTTKTLIEAALFGKEDHLRGLKENVIIGRLIPAGTGFGTER